MKKHLILWFLSLSLATSCSTQGPSQIDSSPASTSGIATTAAQSSANTSANTSAQSPAKPSPSSDSKPLEPNLTIPISSKADAEYRLVISGDVLSHENNWRAAQQSDGSFDYMPQFEALTGLLSAGDLTLVNLETTVSGAKFGYRGFPKFNAPLNMAQTLKDIGVDLVITANNHILDNGLAGLVSNLDNLDAIGLLHTGAARSQAEADTPYLLDINGIKTGFAATTIKLSMDVTEDYSVPLNNEATIRRQIKNLREAGAELVVFHIHWGKEYQEYPSPIQINLYRILEDEGVDIVIGSHPHRLQPMEMRSIDYQGIQKNTAVIWSTANLSWAEPISKDYVNTGAVFKIDVQRQNGQIKVRSLDYDLIYNLTTKTVGGIRYTKIIPESDMEQYKTLYPTQYADMVDEFSWAHKVLNSKVDLKTD